MSDNSVAAPAMKGPLPPYVHWPGFLPSAEHRLLLDHVMANHASFDTAEVIKPSGSRNDPAVRVALRSRDFGALEPMLRERMLAALSRIAASLGTPVPADPSVELELTASGDGAFYTAHRDLSTGPGRTLVGARPGDDRLISAVYYFHREPKRFSGGELRLLRWGASHLAPLPSDYVDLIPANNSLAAFPSWALHEVRPVRTDGDDFADYRFALNCWFCARL